MDSRRCGRVAAGASVNARAVLVVSLSNIGDVILTTPVMMQLLRHYPGAELTVVAGPKAAGLLQGSRHVSRLVVYDKHASLRQKTVMIHELRRRRYEAAVDLRNTLIPFLVSARHRSTLVRRHSKTLMRDRHLEVLAWMGYDVSQDPGIFEFFGSGDAENLDRKLSGAGALCAPGVVIAAGAASERKRWPLESYREVLRGLLNFAAGPVYLIGDAAERSYVEGLVSTEPSRIFNAAGLLTLRESAALIARAPLLLSNDSAAMHLGHELRRPVAAVFGPTWPEKYGRTGPCFRIIAPSAPSESGGFEGVTPDRVLSACRELLEMRHAAHPVS